MDALLKIEELEHKIEQLLLEKEKTCNGCLFNIDLEDNDDGWMTCQCPWSSCNGNRTLPGFCCNKREDLRDEKNYFQLLDEFNLKQKTPLK